MRGPWTGRVKLVVVVVILVLIGLGLWRRFAQQSPPQPESSRPTNQTAATHLAPRWVVDPARPGATLPPIGRSAFDLVMSAAPGAKAGHDIPFPFEALLRRIEQHAGCAAGAASSSCVAAVLIPLGRSLQRTAGTPDFFRYPRVVAAVVGEPGDAEATLLKDRLFIAYQEKAALLEVISYNEEAGRFEFQLVKDYRQGGTPRVIYARPTVCTACHQNQAPIFSRPVWDETNANPLIAARLQTQGRAFYGVKPQRGVDVPNAIDDATDRANQLSLLQLLWREGCVAPACRAALLEAALQFRLSGERGFDDTAAAYRRASAALARQFEQRWPGGLQVPNPDIPNRNPLQSDGDAHVPTSFDPLLRRIPLESIHAHDATLSARAVRGAASFFSAAQIRALDQQLFARARSSAQREVISGNCEFRRSAAAGKALRFRCQGETDVRMEGYLADSERLHGRLGRLHGGTRGELIDLTIEAEKAAGPSPRRVRLQAHKGELRARWLNGNSLERISLAWSEPRNQQSSSGKFEIITLSDFSPLRSALETLAVETRGAPASPLGDGPLQAGRVFDALARELGSDPAPARLANLPAPQTEPATSAAFTQPADPALASFYQYCAPCHDSVEAFPPNFLHGEVEQARGNLQHCAARIYFRLSMWQREDSQRAKTPMPPQVALERYDTDAQRWKNSRALAGMRELIAAQLQNETADAGNPEALLQRPYESLPSCLPRPH